MSSALSSFLHSFTKIPSGDPIEPVSTSTTCRAHTYMCKYDERMVAAKEVEAYSKGKKEGLEVVGAKNIGLGPKLSSEVINQPVAHFAVVLVTRQTFILFFFFFFHKRETFMRELMRTKQRRVVS